jgi:glycosyltransferase involved in cell wall biosynthesis
MATTNARTLVADSAATRDDLVRLHGVAPERVHVAPLGVDARYRPADPAAIAALRQRHGLAHPFVLYVGGIDARKNMTFLLEAFAEMRKGRSAPLELVLAGHVKDAPEYPALQERAKALGLEAALRVLGFVPADELPVLLSSARVFAFPSLYEGFGLPPLEAMACGTPVVSSDRGSLAEVLGDAALVAPADDARAFGAALARLLDDETLHTQLRTRGQARAASFTWERTAEATVVAYRASLAARSR